MMTRFASSLLRGAGFSLLLALFVAGCGSDPRTQVTLYIDGSADVQANAATIRVEFFLVGAAEPFKVELLPAPEWPVTFALVPDMAEDFIAHVYALDSANTILAEGVARTSFANGSTRFYYMYLDLTLCSNAMIDACGPDEFCVDGGICVAAPFTPGSDLPTTPGEGESPNPCEGVTCGTSAVCVPYFGVAVCACPDGFGGDPEVECVDICGQASAPDCGANGACAVDENGEAFCDCAFPFAGAACEGCAEGWQLNGDVCEGACTGMCGLHERCNEDLTVPVCDCEVGYDLLGSECAWVGGGFNGGGFLDGQFADPAAWNSNLVTIDDNEHGEGDGVAEFDLAGVCGTAGIGQTIQMPPYSSAEPFVIEVGIEQRGEEFNCKARPMIRIGDTLQRFSYVASSTPPADQIGTACLPTTGYGPNVGAVLLVDPNEQQMACSLGDVATCEPYAVDYIRIRTAMVGECPAPGTIVNGEFAGATGWTLAASLNGAAGSSSGVTATGFTTVLTKTCQSASATQEVMFPTDAALPNPALRFTGTSEPYEGIIVEVASMALAQPIGNLGTPATTTVCIPPWLQGTTADLRFAVAHPGGTCSVDRVATYAVDDVAFVSEPACAGQLGGLLTDFEDGIANNRLVLPPQTLFPSTTRYSWAVLMDGDSRVWTMSDGGNSPLTATLVAQIPVDETGVRGPAIRMRYRVSNGTQGGRVVINPSTDDTGHAGTTSYATVQSCLNRDVGGQVVPVRFTFSRTGVTAISHYVDDIEIILADGC